MKPKQHIRVSLLAFPLLIAPALAGCLGEDLGAASTHLSQREPSITLDLPVHIVAVGFPDFDEEELKKNLVAPPITFPMARLYTTALIEPDALQYNVRYEVHEAPESFARDLFAYAASIAEPAPPHVWLAEHDRNGLQLICKPGVLPATRPPSLGLPVGNVPDPVNPPCSPMLSIDALAIESWIDTHRADAGLAFPQPGYTVFLLDTWHTEGLPQTTYHQYTVRDNQTTGAMQALRAWGGNSDFVFLDVAAAPNKWDYRPWMNMTEAYTKTRLQDLTDPPIFELEQNDALDANVTLYANIGRHISDAAHMLWARQPLYPFEYAEAYTLPVTVFIDPQAHANPDSILSKIDPLDYEKNTNQAGFQQAFQDLAPWATVTTSFKFVMLPDGDPGMAAAVQDAKSRYQGKYVAWGVVKHYLEEHWSEYVPDAAPGERVYPTFAFILDAPTEPLYAFADGDEVGNSFAVFMNIQDTFTCTHKVVPVCSTATWERFRTQAAWWEWWNGVLVHETGHSFGLNHPHDATSPDEYGFATYNLNWLWDSTASIMSYRYLGLQFDRFDKDVVLRGNAARMAREVLDDPDASDAARDAAQRALDLIRHGKYRPALDAARAAWNEAGTVLPPVIQGAPGEPVELDFEFPASLDPYEIVPAVLPRLPGTPTGRSMAEFPITIPPGAKAVLIEYHEHDAPTHANWAASLYVTNAEHDVVVRLSDNGHAAVALLGIDHCASGCTGHLVVYSGVASGYTVTQTPYV